MLNAGACAILLPLSTPFVSPLLSFPLLSSPLVLSSSRAPRALPLSPYRFPPYTRAATLVFARGEIHPCTVSPRRTPPLHYHHPRHCTTYYYHHYRRQQVDDVYRLGIATMQPIFRRNYHLPFFPPSPPFSREREREREREGRRSKREEKSLHAHRNVRNETQKRGTLTSCSPLRFLQESRDLPVYGCVRVCVYVCYAECGMVR